VPPDFSEYRLPRGRHGIPPEQVRANQRWRLLGSCAEVLAERGYGALTLSAVIEAAAISKGTFYEHFEGLPECLLATYEMATANALAVTREACGPGSDPAAALPVAVESVLGLFAAEPALAHVLTDMALEDVPGLHAAREEFAHACASMLAAAGRGQVDPERHRRLSLHRVRATKGWLASRMRAGAATSLPRKAPELTQLLTV